MFFSIDDQQQRRAKSPHELAMINLLLFNLLIGVALLGGSMAEPDSVIAAYKWLGVGVPHGAVGGRDPVHLDTCCSRA